MSDFSNLIEHVNKNNYLRNSDGSLRVDKLGRRMHINSHSASPGRPRGRIYNTSKNIRMDKDMRVAIELAAKRDGVTVVAKIREYIEWGLENEQTG